MIGRSETFVIKESRPERVIRIINLIATIGMLIIVGWYAWETRRLVDIGTKNLATSERQIKVYQKPRLSLGFTDKVKFAAYKKQEEYETEAQIDYALEKAKKIEPGIFLNIENFSSNDAYFVYIIRYDTKTGEFYGSNFLFNQIPAGQREITYLVQPPMDEKGIAIDLKNIYGWDVLEALKEKGITNPDEKPHNVILLYLDNENELYALTRYAFTNSDEQADLSLPKYYELGSGK